LTKILHVFFTAGTALDNIPSVALLKSLGFTLIATEKVSFYKLGIV
jgi:RimJ/RimL family protein N-acetyltransferase